MHIAPLLLGSLASPCHSRPLGPQAPMRPHGPALSHSVAQSEVAGADEPTARAHRPQRVHCLWLAWEQVKLLMSILRLPASLLPCRPELRRAVGSLAADPPQLRLHEPRRRSFLWSFSHHLNTFPAFNTKKERSARL